MRSVILGDIVIVIGYQWYWSIDSKDIYYNREALGYLGISNEAFTNTKLIHNRIRITGRSNDVIHSMYLPGVHFKIDLLPGRLSSRRCLNIDLVNYGVCAEICGANHAFIPFKYVIVS